MSAVYGPVHSWRLGRSLGIDPIPLKTCNWNCVYCQLGRSVPLTNVRADYLPHDALIAEILLALDAIDPATLDWVTFVGSGEPTLHSALGVLIQAVKQHSPLPVALITNGALLYRPDVRADVLAADAIMPTIAAASEAVFRRLHRPYPTCTLERLLAGCAALRAEYGGQIWVEVMLVRGINDDDQHLVALAERLAPLGADAIHITIPNRATAEAWVAAPDRATLAAAAAILGTVAPVALPPCDAPELVTASDPLPQLIGIIQRHPLRDGQVQAYLAASCPQKASQLCERLAADGRVRRIMRLGEWFWVGDLAHFPPD